MATTIFQLFTNKNHERLLSNPCRDKMMRQDIVKNNFIAAENIKKAKAITIFSREDNVN